MASGERKRAAGCTLAGVTSTAYAVLRFLVALGVAAVLLSSAPARAETRVALVIGNANYASKPLRNARRDGELMAATLKDAGFDVIPVYDASATAMRAGLTEFKRRLQTPGAVALFYYAGHGVQSDGENYLIPLAADISDISDVAINALALGDVMKTLSQAETRLNIVILDACRDNPFAATARTTAQGGLAPAVAPSGTLIGYATAPGQVARDGSGPNSPYTAALAGNIPAAGLTLEEVFRNTRRAVLAATQGRQTPWEHSSLVGAFYFKERPTPKETSAERIESEPTIDARLTEVEAWERIKGSKDPGLFKAHMQRFPNGLFSELAAVRVAKLDAMRAQTPWSWIMTGSVVRTAGGAEAAATFERAVMLESTAKTDEDWRVVASLYFEAAEQGIPQAMYETARHYDKGRGVARDLAEAARWYDRAAEQGHAAAMASLGTMYEFGEGITANLAEALRLYRLSADAGEAAGQTSLAYLLAEGKGAARNAKEARRLYGLAAAKGFARAEFNLALMELAGEGGRKDVRAALRHLTSAAEKGHAGANEELAHLYDSGRAGVRSAERAATHLLAALKSAHRDGRRLDVARRSWTFATKRALQRQLAAKGLYQGMIHGFFDSETRRALVQVAEQD